MYNILTGRIKSHKTHKLESITYEVMQQFLS